jgi:hypothetical protein
MVIVSLIGGDRSNVIWVLVAITIVVVEVLTTAAQEPIGGHSPNMMSTNGP